MCDGQKQNWVGSGRFYSHPKLDGLDLMKVGFARKRPNSPNPNIQVYSRVGSQVRKKKKKIPQILKLKVKILLPRCTLSWVSWKIFPSCLGIFFIQLTHFTMQLILCTISPPKEFT